MIGGYDQAKMNALIASDLFRLLWCSNGTFIVIWVDWKKWQTNLQCNVCFHLWKPRSSMAEKCCFQNATTSQNPKLFHKNHERRFPSRSSESLVRCHGSARSVILWLNAGARPTARPSRCSSGRLPTKLPARRAGSGRSQRHLQRGNLHRVQRQTRISFWKFDLFSLFHFYTGQPVDWLTSHSEIESEIRWGTLQRKEKCKIE